MKLVVMLVLTLLSACALSETEARVIAAQCGDQYLGAGYYNENSKTWWFDMSFEKEGCAPACVVYENESTEINWRCTGLLPEE